MRKMKDFYGQQMLPKMSISWRLLALRTAGARILSPPWNQVTENNASESFNRAHFGFKSLIVTDLKHIKPTLQLSY